MTYENRDMKELSQYLDNSLVKFGINLYQVDVANNIDEKLSKIEKITAVAPDKSTLIQKLNKNNIYDIGIHHVTEIASEALLTPDSNIVELVYNNTDMYNHQHGCMEFEDIIRTSVLAYHPKK